MITLIEKKRQACESLLHNMEEMALAVRNDDFDTLTVTSFRRGGIIRSIAIIDEEAKAAGSDHMTKIEATELLALMQKIADLNESLITIVAERKNIVGKELASLNRGAEVATQYERMGAL